MTRNKIVILTVKLKVASIWVIWLSSELEHLRLPPSVRGGNTP